MYSLQVEKMNHDLSNWQSHFLLTRTFKRSKPSSTQYECTLYTKIKQELKRKRKERGEGDREEEREKALYHSR